MKSITWIRLAVVQSDANKHASFDKTGVYLKTDASLPFAISFENVQLYMTSR